MYGSYLPGTTSAGILTFGTGPFAIGLPQEVYGRLTNLHAFCTLKVANLFFQSKYVR